MNRLSTKLITAALATATLLSLGAVSLSAQAGGAMSTATKAASDKMKASKAPATPPPTDAEIADAKSKGMVWVNTNTKVYHKSDNANYGHTKHGQFMTEADAQKAGYKAAQDQPATGKAKKAAAAAAGAVTPK